MFELFSLTPMIHLRDSRHLLNLIEEEEKVQQPSFTFDIVFVLTSKTVFFSKAI